MFGGSGTKIKLSDTLYQKVRVAAGILGCTIEEFIDQELEGAAERVMSQTSNREPSEADVEDIANKLKGLGYLE